MHAMPVLSACQSPSVRQVMCTWHTHTDVVQQSLARARLGVGHLQILSQHAGGNDEGGVDSEVFRVAHPSVRHAAGGGGDLLDRV